jgi:hypothetical protein
LARLVAARISGWGHELLRASQRRTGSGSVIVGVSGAWAAVAIWIPLGPWDSMAGDAADRGPGEFVERKIERA